MHVLIPTYRRPERLAGLLRHLITLPLEQYASHLYIHITGPEEGSYNKECAELVAYMNAHTEVDVTVTCGYPGLCSAKNDALDFAQARAENLLIVDDDVLLDLYYLQSAAEACDEDPFGIWTGCPFLPLNRGYADWSPTPIPCPKEPPEGYQVLSVKRGKLDFGVKIQVYPLDNAIELPYALGIGYAIGGALLVSRIVKSRFDLFFDTETMGEEIDFSLSVAKEGLSILYNPRALSYHFPALSGGARADAATRERICAINFSYLLQKHRYPPCEDFSGADVQAGS